MPKILLINNRVPFPVKDGGAMASHQLIGGLLDNNEVQLDLFFLNTTKHFLSFEETKEIYKAANKVYHENMSTEVSLIGAIKALLTNNSYNISRFYDSRIEKQLVDICAKSEYDIIHFENLFVAPYAREIRKVSKAKLVLRMHNVEHKIWERLAHEEKGVVKKHYLKILANQLQSFEQNALQYFDGFLPISKEDNEWLKSRVDKKSQVLPAAVDIEEDTNIATGINFFHIGSMEWQPNIKGVQWLLSEVWPMVIAQKPNFKLHLAGRGMKEEEYQIPNDSVTIHGEVESAKGFMLQNNVMVIPLQSASGLRIKALESMALKRPIVSTSIGMSGIEFKNGENCLIANSANEMANAIITLGENLELQEKIAQNAHQYLINNFAKEVVNRQLINFYKEIPNE